MKIFPAELLREKRLLAFGFLMMFWSSPGQTFLISLYGAEIRNTFSLGHGAFGGLYSLGTLASAALIIWTGRLVDRVDLRYLALCLAVLLAVACWLMSLASGVLTLLLAFFALRHIGQGLMSHVAMTSMARYFEAARGRATSVAALGFVVAEAVLPIASIFLIAAFGWRAAWAITGLVALCCLVPVILIVMGDHHARHQRHLRELGGDGGQAGFARRHQWTRGEVLRDRRFHLALPALLAPSILFTGFFFHQVHLVEVKGWSLSWWGAWFGAYAFASLVATVVTGPMVDRFGAVRLMPFFPLPLAAGLGLLSISDAPVVGIGFLLLTGITAGWSVTVSGPMWAELYGVLHIGAIKAMASALMVLGSATSPVFIGWLLDIGVSIDRLASLSVGFVVLASVLAWIAFYRIETPR